MVTRRAFILLSAQGALAGAVVPTLSEWSMLGFAVLLAVFGVVALLRQTRSKPGTDSPSPTPRSLR